MSSPAPRRPAVRLGPGPELVIPPILLAVFAAQVFLWPQMGLAHALSGQAIAAGRWHVLFSHMFLHGGLIHLLMNLMAFTALATPVRLALGRGAAGVGGFLVLFLLSGLAGGLAFLALNPAGEIPAVGASGAICGLWGLAARVGTVEGELTPLASRQVGTNLLSFGLMNLVLVALVSGPQLLLTGETRGGIAWEAHVGGFLVGLLLAVPFQRITGWRPPPPPGPWGPRFA